MQAKYHKFMNVHLILNSSSYLELENYAVDEERLGIKFWLLFRNSDLKKNVPKKLEEGGLNGWK